MTLGGVVDVDQSAKILKLIREKYQETFAVKEKKSEK